MYGFTLKNHHLDGESDYLNTMKSKIKVKRWLGLEEDSGFLTGGPFRKQIQPILEFNYESVQFFKLGRGNSGLGT